MKIFDDKKFKEIQLAKSWFQFKGSKFLSAFLHVLMPLNVTGSVSTLSMERKEVWNYK